MFLKPFRGARINRTHPLARGLVACYLMNEGGGNQIFDLTQNGATGTFVADTAWTTSLNGPALSFDGTDDHVTLVDSSALKVGNLSIVSWFELNDPAAGNGLRGLFSRSDNIAAGGYEFGVRHQPGRDFLAFAYYDGAIQGFYEDNTQIPIDGTPTMAAMIWNKDVVDFYINGVFSSQIDTANNPIIHGATEIPMIGNQAQNNDWIGNIEKIYIYNRTLSGSGVAQLHREPYAFMVKSVAATPAVVINGPKGKLAVVPTCKGLLIGFSSFDNGVQGWGQFRQPLLRSYILKPLYLQTHCNHLYPLSQCDPPLPR